MLDIQLFRTNSAWVKEKLKNRGFVDKVEEVVTLDVKLRELKGALQALQADKNLIAKKIPSSKSKEEKDILIKKGEYIKEALKEEEEQVRIVQSQLDDLLYQCPNLPLNDVPIGKDESQNVEIRRWGECRTIDGAKEHFSIQSVVDKMDFETAALVSGSRFVYLKSHIAQLHRALKNFMLDTLIKEFGYMEMEAPYLVRSHSMVGTGQLPKFADDQFKTTTGLWLIPTAEVSLTNYVREKVLKDDNLPIRMTTASPCFREEAGAAGKDTRGIVRLHQFTKVEMVSIVSPENSEKELERMVSAAESILRKLNLSYRVMVLCDGDMGFSAQKTYDLEVWLPGQSKYREISSCSNCGDFQARRMKAYFKKEGKNSLVHTLNGSGVAVGRALAAVLENYQSADGSIKIPDILLPYMQGIKVISPNL